MQARIRGAVPVLAALSGTGALVAMHVEELTAALAAVPAWVAAATVAAHLATLVLRSEAWRVTLVSAGGERLPRHVVHGANAAAYVAGAFQSQAALPVRIAALRRLGGARAPRPGVILVADAPIVVLEVAAAALLLGVSTLAGGGPWWLAAACAGLAVGVPAAARLAPGPLARVASLRGLAVLADRRRRLVLAAHVAAIVGLTLTRVWLALLVCGLPHGAPRVFAVFAALGVLGLLPIGPGAPPVAVLAALGTASVGASVAAGLILSASSIAAVLLYAPAVAAAARLSRARPRPAQGSAAATDSPSQALPSVRSTISVDQPNPRAPSP